MFNFKISESKPVKSSSKATKKQTIVGVISDYDTVFIPKSNTSYPVADKSKSIKGKHIAVCTRDCEFSKGTAILKDKDSKYIYDIKYMVPYCIGDEVKGVLNNNKEFIIYVRKGKIK